MKASLITAAEMRELTTKAKEKQRQDFLSRVEEAIIEAAKEGKTQISLHNGCYNDVFNYFTPSGFFVEFKGIDCINIS